MIGFEYHGKSTEDIISTPLLLVSYEGIDGLTNSRSKVEGERTISRFITNEYGTIHDPLSFSYALIKEDGTFFTDDEQEAVESWLMSYKLSSELRIIDCNEYSYSYYGLFTQTDWQIGNGGLAICNFTFQVNGSYAFRHFDEVVWDAEEDGAEGEFTIVCHSSQKEEYVYPVLRARCIDYSGTSSFSLEAITDEGQEFNLDTKIVIGIAVDCQRCRAYSFTNTSEGEHEVSQLKFTDMGWGDVDKVYWPRLLPGENKFKITGNVRLTISYDAPYMKVGGWLV